MKLNYAILISSICTVLNLFSCGEPEIESNNNNSSPQESNNNTPSVDCTSDEQCQVAKDSLFATPEDGKCITRNDETYCSECINDSDCQSNYYCQSYAVCVEK